MTDQQFGRHQLAVTANGRLQIADFSSLILLPSSLKQKGLRNAGLFAW
jgi:hypothetical protein